MCSTLLLPAISEVCGSFLEKKVFKSSKSAIFLLRTYAICGRSRIILALLVPVFLVRIGLALVYSSELKCIVPFNMWISLLQGEIILQIESSIVFLLPSGLHIGSCSSAASNKLGYVLAYFAYLALLK